MSLTYRFLRLLGPLVLLGALGACNDNVACVFTTGCVGGGTGVSQGNPALLPEDGVSVLDPQPTVRRVFPAGMAQASSPVGLVFSESMNPDTLRGAFELTQESFGTTTMVPIASQALVGDGHVLVLFPQLPLTGDVTLQLAADAVPTDVTGQRLKASGTLGTITVDTNGATKPSVVTTFPDAGDTGVSDLVEFVVVFDRPMLESSVTDDSFIVTVDGVAPTFDPVAAPLQLNAFGGLASETRVFLYRSVDASGAPVSLGTGTFAARLSPASDPIVAASLGMESLDEVNLSFTLSPVATPTGARIDSNPGDAIGLSNLTAGDPDELRIVVDLADGMPGDRLDLFLFGTNLDTTAPMLVARQRSLRLVDTGTIPITSATFTLADVNLLRSGAGVSPRFAEGRLSFAFRVRRGRFVTPLRVLDVDPTTTGIQDPVLDVTPPSVTGLLNADGLAGVTDDFRSDQRDAVFLGQADEGLRSVEVTLTFPDSSMSSNGVAPPVVGSGASGAFASAPTATDPSGMSGILAGGTAAFSLVAYDDALNPAPPVTGTFRQVGVVGTTPLTPGDLIEVEVYDAVTLAPLAAATVFTHADAGDGVNYPFLSMGATDSLGVASGLASHMAGQAGTIVTVDLTGYDLFTFHGVPTTRLSVPLRPTGLAPSALVSGGVRASSTLAQLALPLSTLELSDTRLDPLADVFYTAGSCAPDPTSGGLLCPYGPEPILADLFGAQSFVAGNFNQTEPLFSGRNLVQAFDLLFPVADVAAGGASVTRVDVPFLLDSLDGAPAEELPIDLPPVALDTQGMSLTGIDLGNLNGDPLTTGDPRVRLETLVPGARRAVPVGIGLAFSQGGGVWRVRSAQPGAVAAGGFYEQNGTADPDLFLRAELRDGAGALSVRRERLSAFAGLPLVLGLPGLVAHSAPVLTTPAPGGSVSGKSYGVSFDDVLPDGLTGLYEVRLTAGVGGRGWTLWRANRDGGANVVVRLPDIEAQGGSALPNGSIAVQLHAWAWTGFDETAFLWSDLPLRYEVHTRSAPFAFTQM